MQGNTADNNRKVATWLLVCCALVFAMVVLGGVTRLTGSGLSMVDWRPVVGALPPLSDAAWQATFEMYQQTPEFQKVNAHMELDDFKGIFWLEYLHRLLGRTIGIVFLIPFLVFAWRGYIQKPEWPKYALMFVLGGMQGVLGWYMVKSGLVDNPHVIGDTGNGHRHFRRFRGRVESRQDLQHVSDDGRVLGAAGDVRHRTMVAQPLRQYGNGAV